MTVLREKRRAVRCSEMEPGESAAINELVDRFGFVDVAKAAGCSVQSVAKAIAKKPLFESTKKRLRSILKT